MKQIGNIQRLFPGSISKEVFRYHAIYLIQKQVMFELARSERDERGVFSDLIKEAIVHGSRNGHQEQDEAPGRKKQDTNDVNSLKGTAARP